MSNQVGVCDFCEKQGLPLLLTRYAIAPVESKAPRLSGTLGGKTLNATPLSAKAYYSLRLVRSGYVYVYNKTLDQWQEYFVTEDGYYFAMPARNANKPRPTPPKDFRCARSEHAHLASVITILNPKHTKEIWIGFSDVEWIDAVFKQHQDEAVRSRHMTKVMLSDGKVVPQRHTAPVEKVTEHVPEFNLEPASAFKHFDVWNPLRYNPRFYQAKDFLAKIRATRPQGGAAIVALYDPVGMALELSARMNYLMEQRLSEGQKNQEATRKHAVASAVLQLRGAIKTQAENDRIDQAVSQPAMLAAIAGMGAAFDPKLRREIEKTGQLSAADLDEAQAQAWKRYTHRQSGQVRFQEESLEVDHFIYQEELNNFVQSEVHPVANDHVKWATSQRMKDYMDSNFDKKDIRSGAAYLETVLKFTQNTQGVVPCFKQYEKWGENGQFSPDNFLLRALLFNHQPLIDQVQAASQLDIRSIPWDNLESAYKSALEHLSQGHQDRVAVLLAQMMGPLKKAADAMIDGGAKTLGIIISLMSGRRLWQYSADSTRLVAREFMTRYTLWLHQGKLNRAQVQVLLDRETKLARIRGENLHGSAKVQWVVLLEPKGSRPVPKTPEQVQFEQFKGVMQDQVRLGVAVAALQFWCITKTYEDYGKALAQDKPEAAARLAAGALAIAGTISEAVGEAIKAATNAQMRWAMGLGGINTARFFIRGGRVLGFLAAAVMATCDWVKAREEFSKGNKLTGWMYRGSALLGIGVAIALGFMGFTPVTLVLVAIFIGVVYWLEKVKDNAIQAWLENCIYGINNVYKSGDEEAKEWRQAIS
jgi:hypothetical protein